MVMVAWEGSLPMHHCGSEGPDVIRERREREEAGGNEQLALAEAWRASER